jgi:hypothetical protein
VRWLRRTANRADEPHPIARRRQALLHYRVAAVRTELLEIAATLERTCDPDPVPRDAARTARKRLRQPALQPGHPRLRAPRNPARRKRRARDLRLTRALALRFGCRSAGREFGSGPRRFSAHPGHAAFYGLPAVETYASFLDQANVSITECLLEPGKRSGGCDIQRAPAVSSPMERDRLRPEAAARQPDAPGKAAVRRRPAAPPAPSLAAPRRTASTRAAVSAPTARQLLHGASRQRRPRARDRSGRRSSGHPGRCCRGKGSVRPQGGRRLRVGRMRAPVTVACPEVAARRVECGGAVVRGATISIRRS